MESIKGIERELVGAYFRDFTGAGRELKRALPIPWTISPPPIFLMKSPGSYSVLFAPWQRSAANCNTSRDNGRRRNNPRLKTLDLQSTMAEFMEAGAFTSPTIESDRERIKQESERRAVAYEFSRGLDALKKTRRKIPPPFSSVVHAIEQEQDKRRETVIKPCSKSGLTSWKKSNRGSRLPESLRG